MTDSCLTASCPRCLPARGIRTHRRTRQANCSKGFVTQASEAELFGEGKRCSVGLHGREVENYDFDDHNRTSEARKVLAQMATWCLDRRAPNLALF